MILFQLERLHEELREQIRNETYLEEDRVHPDKHVERLRRTLIKVFRNTICPLFSDRLGP